jgi:hypothetical protein
MAKTETPTESPTKPGPTTMEQQPPAPKKTAGPVMTARGVTAAPPSGGMGAAGRAWQSQLLQRQVSNAHGQE